MGGQAEPVGDAERRKARRLLHTHSSFFFFFFNTLFGFCGTHAANVGRARLGCMSGRRQCQAAGRGSDRRARGPPLLGRTPVVASCFPSQQCQSEPAPTPACAPVDPMGTDRGQTPAHISLAAEWGAGLGCGRPPGTSRMYFGYAQRLAKARATFGPLNSAGNVPCTHSTPSACAGNCQGSAIL